MSDCDCGNRRVLRCPVCDTEELTTLRAQVAALESSLTQAYDEIDWWADNATREQITANLARHCIDMTEARKVVRAALDARRARDNAARRDAGLGGGE